MSTRGQSPLVYETPRAAVPEGSPSFSRPQRVVIDRFADGGVTVTIRPDKHSLLSAALLPWGVLAIAAAWIGAVIASIDEARLAALVIGGVVVLLCVARIALVGFRGAQPIVIGVSPKGVYFDDPRRLVRRRYYRRDEVQIVQPVTYEVIHRGYHTGGFRHCLEVQMKYQMPMRFLDGKKGDDAIAASNALRDALGLDKAGGEVRS